MDEPAAPIVGRLRAQFAREVGRLGYTAQSLPAVALHFAAYVGLAVLTAVFTDAVIEASAWGWALYPLAAFVIATRFRAVGNMLHEACHGMLVRGKRRNAVLGHLLAILDFTSLPTYTREHFTHHQFLGDPERDLDFATRERFGFADRSGRFLLRHILRPLTLFHVPTFVRPVLFSREDPLWVSVGRVAYLGLLAALGLWVGWLPLLLYFVLPYVTAYQVIRYWSDAIDHAQVIREPDEFFRSRNHLFRSRLLNLLLLPRNDAFHLVHHLFPAVPTPYQPVVHSLLLRDPVYAGRDHSFSQLLS